MEQKFVSELLKLGIVAYKEQETLYQIAKRCAASTGLPMAGAGALYGLKFGTVTVPGYGSVAGPVVGALAGLFAGTFSCSMLNISMRQELKKLARGR